MTKIKQFLFNMASILLMKRSVMTYTSFPALHVQTLFPLPWIAVLYREKINMIENFCWFFSSVFTAMHGFKPECFQVEWSDHSTESSIALFTFTGIPGQCLADNWPRQNYYQKLYLNYIYGNIWVNTMWKKYIVRGVQCLPNSESLRNSFILGD